MDYRIDELARLAGTSVRNVRYYQDGGMLPPPRRHGRVALYSEAHLARLKLIIRMLNRGYIAANITELVTAWERGRDLSEVLGLEHELSGFLTEEPSGYLTVAEIHALFATTEAGTELVAKIESAGLAAPAGDRYRVPSLPALHAVAELIKAGAPSAAVLEHSGQMLRGIDENVRGLVSAIADHLLRGREHGWMPSSGDLPDLAGLFKQIRPLATTAATAALNLSLDRHVEDLLGDYIDRLMPYFTPNAEPHTA